MNVFDTILVSTFLVNQNIQLIFRTFSRFVDIRYIPWHIQKKQMTKKRLDILTLSCSMFNARLCCPIQTRKFLKASSYIQKKLSLKCY